jgi:hypothetical protein
VAGTPSEKKCNRCGEVKLASLFHRNRSTADGLHKWCKACRKDVEGARHFEPSIKSKMCARCKQSKPAAMFSRDKHIADGLASICKACNREDKLQRKYGISSSDYEELLRSQGGGCQICGSFDRLHVDHCHVSTKVRGILCAHCNQGLGHFFDNTALLLKAALYLKKHGHS